MPDPISIALSAVRAIGKGRKEADIVGAAEAPLQPRLVDLIIGLQTGSIRDYAGVARELDQMQSLWTSEVLSRLEHPQVRESAMDFVYGTEGGIRGPATIANVRKVLAEESAKRGWAAPVQAPQYGSGLPVDVGFDQFAFPGSGFNRTQPAQGWGDLAAGVWGELQRRVPGAQPAQVQSAGMPEWVLPAVAVVGLWLLFGPKR